MNITDMLGQTASVAVAAERATEVLKPIYLSVKNKIFKKDQTECTKLEKITMTILLCNLICIVMGISLGIPGIPNASILQNILAGLVSSFGSNILHIVINILSGVQVSVETRNARRLESGTQHAGSQ